LADGSARCWGENQLHQLGNDSTVDSHVPVQVLGLTSGVTAISTGNAHTCALVNGGIQCWGNNGNGQLGNNSWKESPIPVQVYGLASGATAIAAGQSHSCAVTDNGVQCWGAFSDGELAESLVPVQVQGITSGVTAIAAGENHTCAVINGGARCWGDDGSGELGDGNPNVFIPVPVQVQGLTSGVTAITAFFRSTCSLVKGVAQCWGYNAEGELGNGSTIDSAVPVQVRFP
jgi:alpha-tubulin suppressor-like RCC1 family protein